MAGIVATPAVHLTPSITNSAVVGLTPPQVRHAYGFDRIAFGGGTIAGDGSGQTIAIVDAYDHPNILSDLKFFDQTFGLPDPVFTKATPQGKPRTDAGWALEIALDVEWAHAIAPRASILLVEARSASLSDLLGAVDYARKQPGVVAVSMSWGSDEFWGETTFDARFTTPVGHIGGSGLAGGVTFVAASGDDGAWFGAGWPAVSPNVLGVGGTRLSTDSQGNYLGETGWNGSGGGYSSYERRPAYQNGAQTSPMRTTPDVAYDADPYSGFAVYDTVTGAGATGWLQIGGTSAGAPQWAALVAIADQGRALAGKGSLANAQATIYALPSSDFHDITIGSNGYRAGLGYDLVTGRGSPYADRVVSHLLSGGTTSASTSITTSSSRLSAKLTRSIVFAPREADGESADCAAEPALPASPMPTEPDNNVFSAQPQAMSPGTDCLEPLPICFDTTSPQCAIVDGLGSGEPSPLDTADAHLVDLTLVDLEDLFDTLVGPWE